MTQDYHVADMSLADRYAKIDSFATPGGDTGGTGTGGTGSFFKRETRGLKGGCHSRMEMLALS